MILYILLYGKEKQKRIVWKLSGTISVLPEKYANFQNIDQIVRNDNLIFSSCQSFPVLTVISAVSPNLNSPASIEQRRKKVSLRAITFVQQLVRFCNLFQICSYILFSIEISDHMI